MPTWDIVATVGMLGVATGITGVCAYMRIMNLPICPAFNKEWDKVTQKESSTPHHTTGPSPNIVPNDLEEGQEFIKKSDSDELRVSFAEDVCDISPRHSQIKADSSAFR